MSEFRSTVLDPKVPGSRKLSLIEILIDHRGETEEFEARFNDAAEKWRVGIRLEGTRFVAVESEELHERIVRPALFLLRDPQFEEVEHRCLGVDVHDAVDADADYRSDAGQLDQGGDNGAGMASEHAESGSAVAGTNGVNLPRFQAFSKRNDCGTLGTASR